MAGHGTDSTGAGIAIPLGHAVSARFHVDNGIANAIVLPHVLRFNEEAARAGLDKLGISLNAPVSEGHSALVEVCRWIEGLLDALGLPRRLRDIGVTRESLPELAAISMEDWFVRDNPRPVRGAAELEQVLRDAW
jgi:alcohol dehydrogenase class IV